MYWVLVRSFSKFDHMPRCYSFSLRCTKLHFPLSLNVQSCATPFQTSPLTSLRPRTPRLSTAQLHHLCILSRVHIAIAYFSMATPYSRSSSNASLNAGPSRTLLQQLLEEINGAPTPRRAPNESTSHSPSSTHSWSSSHIHSPSVWVGGSSFAQDARDKLRAADQARRQRSASGDVDGASDLKTPVLRLDTSGSQMQNAASDEAGENPDSGPHQTPDPVKYPHEYMQYMMKGSPISTTGGPTPSSKEHDSTPFHLQAPVLRNDSHQPLSPLIFNDVDFDLSSSPRTETTASPTEAPPSAATIFTAEEPPTPSDEGSVRCMD